jgi:pantetheine-phosphate adenylyltransferase
MRVIAGTARGRRLTAPPGNAVWPTSDRVREALFSIVADRVPEAVVLDLYAGSGALAIEALSRGAARAVLVERDDRVARVAAANLDRAGVSNRARLLRMAAARFCSAPSGGPFDLVFCDPPYTTPLAEVHTRLADLHAAGGLVGGALVVVERDKRDPALEAPPPAFLARGRMRSYGDTVLVPYTARGAAVTSAVCPGSFDPVTNGHLDVIERAARRFDRLVVACTRNLGKPPLFDIDERLQLLEAVTAHLDNVVIHSFEGLLVDFCRAHDVRVIVKGLRAVSDFEYELQMAQMNAHIGDVETLFMTTSPLYSFLSSSLVKEVARFGGDITDLVPEVVAKRLHARLGDGGGS